MPATTDTICVPFPEWAVRGFLDERKSQFRVPVDPQPPHDNVEGPEVFTPAVLDEFDHLVPGEEGYGVYGPFGEWGAECPYPPGTEIAVQEAFRLPEWEDDYSAEQVLDMRAGWLTWLPAADGVQQGSGGPMQTGWGRLRPAEEMPEALCRLYYVVEDVNVERACEIDHIDAAAEGVRTSGVEFGPPQNSQEAHEMSVQAYIGRFHELYTDHYGPDAWEQWCWKYVVSRIDE